MNEQISSNEKNNSKDLTGVFKPVGVAIVGASGNPGKIGFQILQNTIETGFEGEIYPVNPKESQILGKVCYPTVAAIPGRVDLAVIAVPAKFVAASLKDCAQKGVKNVSIITSGFAEVGNMDGEREI